VTTGFLIHKIGILLIPTYVSALLVALLRFTKTCVLPVHGNKHRHDNCLPFTDFNIVRPACAYGSMQWCEWLYMWRGAAFHTGLIQEHHVQDILLAHSCVSYQVKLYRERDSSHVWNA
jgi:hypothetical protein